MIPRGPVRALRNNVFLRPSFRSTLPYRIIPVGSPRVSGSVVRAQKVRQLPLVSTLHTSAPCHAQSPTADALMENLNDLYATAKDEFEIAAEETEKKTVYAADDREAAQDALKILQEAFAKAVKESDPEVAKEIQGRVGQRIRELENAVKAMEEMALED